MGPYRHLSSMKAVISVTGFALASAVVPHPDRVAQVRELQDTPGILWKASLVDRFASKAPGASRSMNGVLSDWRDALRSGVSSGKIVSFTVNESLSIPTSFDSATNWPQCAKVIGDIRDQSDCGCCWAFAGAEAASDRMCITSNAALLMPLSAQDVCFCASSDGCNGGQIDTPWDYIQSHGAVTGGQYQGSGPFGTGFCSDFSLPHCHHHGPQGDDPYPDEGTTGCSSASSPQCPSSCDSTASSDHSPFGSDKYTFSGQVASANGVAGIQQMIMSGGPVETAFTVYSDFENYDGGIYHHVSGSSVGGHAVKIVGWGEENGVNYWRIANSWNPYWGENGYFRIRFGEGGIDDSVVASSADATYSKMSPSPSPSPGPSPSYYYWWSDSETKKVVV